MAGSVRDAAYDLLARRYLDKEAILPVVRIAWSDAAMTAHAEAFLRAAAERSAQSQGARPGVLQPGAASSTGSSPSARDLDNPVRGEWMQGTGSAPERVRRIRELKPEELRREAEALYERTIREYGDLQPMGKAFPPLGEQARGDLFKLRHLEPGCTVPEIEGEDIDGRPMKLSDFRGKVVVLSFWATWCGPCMGMVPAREGPGRADEGPAVRPGGRQRRRRTAPGPRRSPPRKGSVAVVLGRRPAGRDRRRSGASTPGRRSTSSMPRG